MQWIPVEQAMPPSGRRVLFIWKNKRGLDRISIGFYVEKYSEDASGWGDHYDLADYCEEDDNYYWPEGWHEWGWETEYSSMLEGVTHWMPLPEMPKP